VTPLCWVCAAIQRCSRRCATLSRKTSRCSRRVVIRKPGPGLYFACEVSMSAPDDCPPWFLEPNPRQTAPGAAAG